MKKTWEVKRLGEVCEIIGGGTPSKANPKFYNGDIPWATVRDMKFNVIKETEHKITKEAVRESSANIIPRNNVIIATRVGLGKICFLENDTAINQDLKGIIPINSNELFMYYLYYWLNSISEIIVKNGTGATVQGVKLPFIKSLKIPLPPLPEQRRIVAILDKSFAAIAKAKENAEKNLQNTREIFQSTLQTVFASPGDEWKAKRLGEVCEIIGGGTPSKANPKFYNGDIPWATVRDMKFNVIKGTEHKITKEAVRESSANIIPRNNVIIATRVGLGKICFLENDTAINQDLKGIIPINSNELFMYYLYYWLNSISESIVKNGTGATVQGVKLPFIKSLKIPLPPLPEQQRIVAKLDALALETTKLQTMYQQKLIQLEELKKSILHKAFNGELTGEEGGEHT